MLTPSNLSNLLNKSRIPMGAHVVYPSGYNDPRLLDTNGQIILKSAADIDKITKTTSRGIRAAIPAQQKTR